MPPLVLPCRTNVRAAGALLAICLLAPAQDHWAFAPVVESIEAVDSDPPDEA